MKDETIRKLVNENFNRTKVECKSRNEIRYLYKHRNFNRTKVECKCGIALYRFSFPAPLIELK